MEVFTGIGLVAKTPRLWPLCLLPGALAIVLYAFVGWAVWHFGIEPRLGDGLARWIAVALWLVLFPFVFVLLSGAFLGLVFEPLARAVEAMRGEVPPQRLTSGEIFGDSLVRLCFNLALGLLAFFLGFVAGPFPGILAAAIVGLLDYTSPAYQRRGFSLGKQIPALLKKPDRPTVVFALMAGLLSLVPFAVPFLAPGLIAGGVLLARRRLEPAVEPSAKQEPAAGSETGAA